MNKKNIVRITFGFILMFLPYWICKAQIGQYYGENVAFSTFFPYAILYFVGFPLLATTCRPVETYSFKSDSSPPKTLDVIKIYIMQSSSSYVILSITAALFFAVFSIIGIVLAIANTIPFWITEWKNDGSDVYLMLHNSCARDSFLAALQIDRHVYLGNSILSANCGFLQPKEYGDDYSFGLAQMYAYLFLLKGKYSEQREFIAKVKASNDTFVKQKSELLDAMIIENKIISGAPIELVKGCAEQQDFKLISKYDRGLACRLLYWLSVKGFAPAESAPEYYAEQHEKYISNCGSQADAELAANVMKLINKAVSQENT